MKLRREFRSRVLGCLAVGVLTTPLHALVTFNDGHDHIYVTGTIGVAHDSNIFASQQSAGDTVYRASLLAEYARRAGWIAVNGSVEVEATRFENHAGENFTNPHFDLEFMKQG